LLQTIKDVKDEGVPAIKSEDAKNRQAFADFAVKSVRSTAMQNAQTPPTKVV
jgi:hypothetical protein